MIKEAYCSFEVARLLKEKGFDEQTRYAYTESGKADFSSLERYWNQGSLYACPTHQMAMAWLREEKHISIIIEFDVTKRGYCPYVYVKDYEGKWVCEWRVNMPMKYEEAVEEALKYSLENLI